MERKPENKFVDQVGPQSRAQMRIRVKHLKDQTREDDLVGTTIEQRWDMMWPLAITAWEFKGEEDADAEGLPRRIARLIRGKR
jgi:hypothetical protein